MGLFSKKRKEEEDELELPPLRFPEAPDLRRMQGETETIKKAVTKGSFHPSIKQPGMMPPARELMERTHVVEGDGKTVFVKIAHYKEAMRKMDDIKDKLIEAEKLLRNLEELKRKENEELRTWHQDLQIIKQGLLNIDKTLFE